MDLNDPRYAYADILIAMANIDGNVDDKQRELIDGIFKQMDLDPDTTATMWMTPMTPDVMESKLTDIEDESFKRCLLKDCYLLAYADGEIVAEEEEMLTKLAKIMNIATLTVEEIHEWVKVAVEQRIKAEKLFG